MVRNRTVTARVRYTRSLIAASNEGARVPPRGIALVCYKRLDAISRPAFRRNPMRVAVFCLLVLGLSQTLHGQQENASQPPPLVSPCSIGFVPILRRRHLRSFRQRSKHCDTAISTDAHGLVTWSGRKRSAFPKQRPQLIAAMRSGNCRGPSFRSLQPLRIEEASHSSDPWGRVVVLFRLSSGRQVKLTFPVDDRAWQSDDPLPILAFESGLYLDPYNTPFTPAEVQSIPHKDFDIGTRREVLECAGARVPPGGWHYPQQQWWILDGREYPFKDGRVAEIRAVKE